MKMSRSEDRYLAEGDEHWQSEEGYADSRSWTTVFSFVFSLTSWIRLSLALGLAFAAYGVTERGVEWLRVAMARHGRYLMADFDGHELIVFHWPETLPQADTLTDVIRALPEDTDVVVLSNPDGKGPSQDLLRAVQQARPVRVLPIRQETPAWIRDELPPLIKQGDGTFGLLQGSRPDQEPQRTQTITQLASLRRLTTRLNLPAGSYLTNGSQTLIVDAGLPARIGIDPSRLRRELNRELHIHDLLWVELPSQGRSSQWEDFACFVTRDTLLVGQLSPNLNPVVSEQLDAIERQLAGVVTSTGPIRVKRLPMAAISADQWRSYTSAVFVDHTVLVPSYSNVDPVLESQVLDTYRQALPGWKLKLIPSDSLAESGGSLRRASVRLNKNGWGLDPQPAKSFKLW